jgi:hypothetical protein
VTGDWAMSQKQRLTDTSQIRSFQDAARELGCSDSEDIFNGKLGKVARAAVPRKPAARVKVTKPQQVEKAANADAPAKKKTRFNLPGA